MTDDRVLAILDLLTERVRTLEARVESLTATLETKRTLNAAQAKSVRDAKVTRKSVRERRRRDT